MTQDEQKLAVAQFGAGVASLCDSCATGAACRVVGPTNVDLAGGEVLKLTPDPSIPWSGFAPIVF